jgi:hypothetical protein
MKCIRLAIVFGFIMIFSNGLVSFAAQSREELIVADFDSGTKPNNLGQDFGVWNYDPADKTQGCVMEFSSDDAKRTGGSSLKLTYDVDSPNPAFNGFWMKIEGIDLSPYNYVRFWVKGDHRFMSEFKIELKSTNGERASYSIIKELTEEWQELIIAFKDTPAIAEWRTMSEFTIVFSDRAKKGVKQGTLFIDDISFFYVPEQKK